MRSALSAAVLEEAALAGHERVLDLYCGAGTITLLLARRAREVVGCEAVADAVAAALHHPGVHLPFSILF